MQWSNLVPAFMILIIAFGMIVELWPNDQPLILRSSGQLRVEAEAVCSTAMRHYNMKNWALATEHFVYCADLALPDQFTSETALATHHAINQLLVAANKPGEPTLGEVVPLEKVIALLRRSSSARPGIHGYYLFLRVLREGNEMAGVRDVCTTMLDVVAGPGIQGEVKEEEHLVLLPAVVADCFEAYTRKNPLTAIKKLNTILVEGSSLSEEEKHAIMSSPRLAVVYAFAARKQVASPGTAANGWELLQPYLVAAEKSGDDVGQTARAWFIGATLLDIVSPDRARAEKVQAYELWASGFHRKPGKLAVTPGDSMLSSCTAGHANEWTVKHDLFNDAEYAWRSVGPEATSNDSDITARLVATTLSNAVVHSMQEDDIGTMFVFHDCNILLTSNVVETVPPPSHDSLRTIQAMRVITLPKATILGQRALDVEDFQHFQLPALLALRESGDLLSLAPFLMPDIGLSATLTSHGLPGDMFTTFHQYSQYHVSSLTLVDLSHTSRLAALPSHLAIGPSEQLPAARKILTSRHANDVVLPGPIALFLGEQTVGTATLKKEADFIQKVAKALKQKKIEGAGGQALETSCINSFSFVTELPEGVTTATILVGPEPEVTFVSMELSGVEVLISFPCFRHGDDESSAAVIAAKLGIGHTEVPELRHFCGSMFRARGEPIERVAEAIYRAMARHCRQ